MTEIDYLLVEYLKLREKGIDKEMIQNVVSSAVDDEEELRNAMTAAEKKAASIRHDDPKKWERSMANFLATRGFGWDVVGKVLERYRKERKQGSTEE